VARAGHVIFAACVLLGIGHVELAGEFRDVEWRVAGRKPAVSEPAASRGKVTDTVLGSVDIILAANVENLTFTGTGDFSGTGNTLANVITGGAGNDTLTGGAGKNTLSGNNGDDHCFGDIGDDSVVGNALRRNPRPPKPVLDADASGPLRDQLVNEIAALSVRLHATLVKAGLRAT
jgi:hypothetical protein